MKDLTSEWNSSTGAEMQSETDKLLSHQPRPVNPQAFAAAISSSTQLESPQRKSSSSAADAVKSLADAPAIDDNGAASEFPPAQNHPMTVRQDLLTSLKLSLANCHDFRDAQMMIAGYLRVNLNAPLIAWYYPAGAQIGKVARIESLVCPTEGMNADLRQLLKEQATEAVHDNAFRTGEVPGQPRLRSLICPLSSPPGNALIVLLESDSASAANTVSAVKAGQFSVSPVVSREVLQLNLASTLLEDWSSRQRLSKASADAAVVAAMIEIIGRTHAALDAPSACQRLADQLQDYLQSDKVFVGLCRSAKSEPRLIAISGERDFDRLSDETRSIEATLHESVVRSAAAIWPSGDLIKRHALFAHQHMAGLLRCEHIVSIPLISETGSRSGAILVTFGQTGAAHSDSVNDKSDPGAASHYQESDSRHLATRAERILQAGMIPLASCLEVIQRLADSRWIHTVRRLRTWLTTQKLRTAGCLLGIFAVTMLIPAQYKIRCRVELQPIERRYVAAPFAGPLEECLVEPGDLVEADQLLARMDAREIRWELAGVRADLHKATKERNTHLSAHDFGDAAIARHEVERLKLRTELLQHRDSNLEIRSPISGIIVSGDHREAEGVPMDQGQTLFEVAPLERMVVQISVPEQDIRHAAAGMTIRIQLDAVPEQIFEATIRRIHPRSEIVDNENVFIAEAELLNTELQLRPGMRGAAKVIGERHALGWNWFHKPVAHVLGWLGW